MQGTVVQGGLGDLYFFLDSSILNGVPGLWRVVADGTGSDLQGPQG